MPTKRTSKTQQELEDALETIAAVKSTLEDAYTPEASRETLASAIGDALDSLADYGDEGEMKSGDDED